MALLQPTILPIALYFHCSWAIETVKLKPPTKAVFVLHLILCLRVTNTARCLVTNQTAFYTMGSTKKLSLKRCFFEAVFTCFFN
jgi:hypothetical protein